MNTMGQIKRPRLSLMLYSEVCLWASRLGSPVCWAKQFEQSIVGTVIRTQRQTKSRGHHTDGWQLRQKTFVLMSGKKKSGTMNASFSYEIKTCIFTPPPLYLFCAALAEFPRTELCSNLRRLWCDKLEALLKCTQTWGSASNRQRCCAARVWLAPPEKNRNSCRAYLHKSASFRVRGLPDWGRLYRCGEKNDDYSRVKKDADW